MSVGTAALQEDSFVVCTAPIDVAALQRRAAAPAWGAVVTFLGSVRSPNAGAQVDHIDYEGYEGMMLAEMRRIAAELRQRYALGRVLVAHRLGRLCPGEVSLAAVVASAHRADAFAALGDLVEALKARLPVWKYEVGGAGEGFVAGRSEAGPTL